MQEAIGGHMQVLVDGKQGVANGSTAEYPTTLIGYRDDGSVMLCTVTSTAEKKYAGLKFAHAYKFCRELGYNSVFYLTAAAPPPSCRWRKAAIPCAITAPTVPPAG